MKKILVFTNSMSILCSIIFLASCSSSEDLIPEPNYDRNIDFRSIDSFLINTWHEAYDSLGLEFLCACTGESVDSLQNLYNRNLNDLKNEISGLTTINYDTSDLKIIAKYECDFQDLEEYQDSVYYKMSNWVQTDIITSSEDSLILDLIEDVKSGTFSYSGYINRINNLQDASYVDNEISLLVVETTESVIDFFDVRPEFVNEEEDIAAAWHIVSALVGGFLSVAYDVFTDPGIDWETGDASNAEFDTPEEVLASFKKGYILGAIGAI